MRRAERTPGEQYLARMRLNAALGYAALLVPGLAMGWAVCHLPWMMSGLIGPILMVASAMAAQLVVHRLASRPWLSRRAISALDSASADAALYALYTSRRTSRLALQDEAADRAIVVHLQRLASTKPRSAQAVVRDAIRVELDRATTTLRYGRSRAHGRAYILAHIHAAAAIGAERYVRPLADLATMDTRNAGEEEVRAAAAEALRVVQARLGEANDHLLRPADAPGETLLRPAEPAAAEALLRAVAGGEAEERQELGR